jgi:hypothetical protein
MRLDFGQGMTIPLTLASEWLFIEEAQGKLDIEIQETGERVKLGRKSLYKSSNRAFGRLLITGAGQVELEHGIGDFTPPVEGQQLAVQSMPDVTIESLPPVEIQSLPSVAINSLPEVAIKQLPQVVIQSLPQVSIATQPAVEVAPNQQITVSEMPAINVASGQEIGVNALPDVQLAAGQQVGVTALPDVTIAEKQYVRIESMPVQKIATNQFVGIRRSKVLATKEVSVFPHEVPLNEDRQKLILKAPSTNTAPIMVGAFSLDAGERLDIESVAAVTITGTTGDTLQLMEW